MNIHVDVVTRLAGLQFYDYRERHPLDVHASIEPAIDEPLELVRCPENAFDSNAIEVWFRNRQYQLGHIPRDLAAQIAPLLDKGVILDTRTVRKDRGIEWSLVISISGDCMLAEPDEPEPAPEPEPELEEQERTMSCDDDYDDDIPF